VKIKKECSWLVCVCVITAGEYQGRVLMAGESDYNLLITYI